jgi:hypothetical protein
MTGKGGWYVHWNLGAPKQWRVEVSTVPRGSSIILATRYPAATTFNVTKAYSWTMPSLILSPASSLAEVLNDFHGEKFFWDGKLLVSGLESAPAAAGDRDHSP